MIDRLSLLVANELWSMLKGSNTSAGIGNGDGSVSSRKDEAFRSGEERRRVVPHWNASTDVVAMEEAAITVYAMQKCFDKLVMMELL